MKSPKFILVLFLSTFLLGCVFEENRKVEKMLIESVENLHVLLNQERFGEIYLSADDELKNRLTEQQFVSYLEVVKNDVGEIKTKPFVSIKDELKDGVKRIWSNRTKFQILILFQPKRRFMLKKSNGT